MAEDSRELQSFHMSCQRQILGMKWHDHAKNSDIAYRVSIDGTDRQMDGQLADTQTLTAGSQAASVKNVAAKRVGMRLTFRASLAVSRLFWGPIYKISYDLS